jgi:hypothetical protein
MAKPPSGGPRHSSAPSDASATPAAPAKSVPDNARASSADAAAQAAAKPASPTASSGLGGDTPLNDQPPAAAADLAALTVGMSPAQSMALLDTALAQALGQAMHNAVLRQHADRVVSQALVSAACARLLEHASLLSNTPAAEAKP